MTTTLFFLVLSMTLFGQDPQAQLVQMPNMETCLQQQQRLLNNPPKQLGDTGGTLQASCIVVLHVEPRRA